MQTVYIEGGICMRRRYARLLTLVLALGLAVLCCACARLGSHRCDHGPRCAVCEAVRLGLRTGLLLSAALPALIARVRLGRGRSERRAACHALTLFDRRVQLND